MATQLIRARLYIAVITLPDRLGPKEPLASRLDGENGYI